ALAHASARSRLAPLVRALGLEPRNAPVPPDARGAFGLAGAEDVRGLCVIGERGGLIALVIERAGGLTTEVGAPPARRVRAHDPARPYLFLFAAQRYRRLAFASFGLDGELRHLVLDRARPRASELEALEEMVAKDGEGGVALALRHARALDRTRVTRQFFRDFRAQRAAVAEAWTGVPADAKPERDQLALLLLSRLMFLYFLQRTGHLAGDPGYLPGLLARWRRGSDELRAGAGATLPPAPIHPGDRPSSPRCPGGGTAGETAGGGVRGRPRRSGASFGAGRGTFYRCVLEPLFFGALNTRPERRDERARALGELPYLNGGLFERHALERRFSRLDLPDLAIVPVFDELLERYRFTARDAAEAAAEPGIPVEGGIDPEMLGRVFEELMAADRRGATGTYYTPAPVVARLVREALGAYMADRPARVGPGTAALKRDLAEIRVLDPACGSGAFLLGALSQLVRLRAALGDVPPGGLAELRRQIIGRSLHGVDLQEDAALLCALRLWLALAVGAPGEEVVGGPSCGDAGAGRHAAAGPGAAGHPRSHREATDGPPVTYAAVPPLPNLDRRIRQGDALVDPLDLVAWPDGAAGRPGGLPAVAADVTVRQAIRAIGPLAARYLTAGPEEKPELQRRLATAEAELAGAWISSLDRRLHAAARELRADAATRDLFGERPPEARAAEAALEQTTARLAELGRLRTSLEEAGALPFFSFGVHFAEAAERGFDLVLSNPPWVRAHRWPAALRSLVRRRYAVCRSPGWRRGAELAGAPAAAGAQVDLSLLFLERSIRLLAPSGALAMLLP